MRYALFLATALLAAGGCVDASPADEPEDLSCVDDDDCLPAETCDTSTELCVHRDRPEPTGADIDLELYRRCANNAALPECQTENAELHEMDSEVLEATPKPPAP